MNKKKDALSDKFFILLRCAIGTGRNAPMLTFAEFEQIYKMSKKQSVTALIFAAIQHNDIRPTDLEGNGEAFGYLLMEWMGENIKTNRKNKKLDKDVGDAVAWLHGKDFECCLLKGQGNALLYPQPSLRTPGDIDLWVRPRKHESQKQSIKSIIDITKNINQKTKASYHHVDGTEMNGTELELHYRPHFMQNFIDNARLQRFFINYADEQFQHFVKIGNQEIAMPTPEFNIIFQLSHIYQHLFNEGIGLRQIVDYYYVLKKFSQNKLSSVRAGNVTHSEEKEENTSFGNIERLLRHLKLNHIAGAIMWILITQLGMDERLAIVSPDGRRGRYVLHEILLSGNFGQYDKRNARYGHGIIGRNAQRLARDFRLVRYFPSEALSEPFFRLWHAWWRWRHN